MISFNLSKQMNTIYIEEVNLSTLIPQNCVCVGVVAQ